MGTDAWQDGKGQATLIPEEGRAWEDFETIRVFFLIVFSKFVFLLVPFLAFGSAKLS